MYDAKGLLIAAIEDKSRDLLEPKRLYNGPVRRAITTAQSSPWAKHEPGAGPITIVPLGPAAIRRAGSAVTMLPTAPWCSASREAAPETGIDAEITDLRTLVPYDLTHRRLGEEDRPLRRVHEATLTRLRRRTRRARPGELLPSISKRP